MFPQSNFVLVLLAATTRCFSSEGMAEGNDAGRIALCFTHAHYRKVSVFSVDELSETTENDSVDAECFRIYQCRCSLWLQPSSLRFGAGPLTYSLQWSEHQLTRLDQLSTCLSRLCCLQSLQNTHTCIALPICCHNHVLYLHLSFCCSLWGRL